MESKRLCSHDMVWDERKNNNFWMHLMPPKPQIRIPYVCFMPKNRRKTQLVNNENEKSTKTTLMYYKANQIKYKFNKTNKWTRRRRKKIMIKKTPLFDVHKSHARTLDLDNYLSSCEFQWKLFFDTRWCAHTSEENWKRAAKNISKSILHLYRTAYTYSDMAAAATTWKLCFEQ